PPDSRPLRRKGVRRLLSRPGGIVAGRHRVPGDKSISHRALLLAAAAGGTTRITNFLNGDDCLATAAALRALGTDIEIAGDSARVAGDGACRSPGGVLDLGNSGTGLRLLAGLLAGHALDVTL